MAVTYTIGSGRTHTTPQAGFDAVLSDYSGVLTEDVTLALDAELFSGDIIFSGLDTNGYLLRLAAASPITSPVPTLWGGPSRARISLSSGFYAEIGNIRLDNVEIYGLRGIYSGGGGSALVFLAGGEGDSDVHHTVDHCIVWANTDPSVEASGIVLSGSGIQRVYRNFLLGLPGFAIQANHAGASAGSICFNNTAFLCNRIGGAAAIALISSAMQCKNNLVLCESGIVCYDIAATGANRSGNASSDATGDAGFTGLTVPADVFTSAATTADDFANSEEGRVELNIGPLYEKDDTVVPQVVFIGGTVEYRGYGLFDASALASHAILTNAQWRGIVGSNTDLNDVNISVCLTGDMTGDAETLFVKMGDGTFIECGNAVWGSIDTVVTGALLPHIHAILGAGGGGLATIGMYFDDPGISQSAVLTQDTQIIRVTSYQTINPLLKVGSDLIGAGQSVGIAYNLGLNGEYAHDNWDIGATQYNDPDDTPETPALRTPDALRPYKQLRPSPRIALR